MIAARGFIVTEEAKILANEKIDFMKKTATTYAGNGRILRRPAVSH